MPARIRKGDMVVVVAGKDRNLATAHRVLQVLPAEQRVLVEGVNRIKRHTRANPQRNVKGGILEKEAPIHISNVMAVDPESNKPTRVGCKVLKGGKRARVARRSGAMLDK